MSHCSGWEKYSLKDTGSKYVITILVVIASIMFSVTVCSADIYFFDFCQILHWIWSQPPKYKKVKKIGWDPL